MAEIIDGITYFDCAEEDYEDFLERFELKEVRNSMAVTAQGCCEKYLKHLLQTYAIPNNQNQYKDIEIASRSHDLPKIVYVLEKFGISFSLALKKRLILISRYYFSARYPDSSFGYIKVDKDDILDCKETIEMCRTETVKIMNDRN